MINTVITGSGSFIPEISMLNKDFLKSEFFDADGVKFQSSNEEIIEKFRIITGINERRYADKNLMTSDIAAKAAETALTSSDTNPEELDCIIVAHNFGDVSADNKHVDVVPSIASRVKAKLGIKNPRTIPYDICFGCPGWLQGIIQADSYVKSGFAEKIMVIGADILSRISDPHDRDSMIYADGAGATIVEKREQPKKTGILSYSVRSDTFELYNTIWMDKSNNKEISDDTLFLKMNGHKLYQYVLKNVPSVVKESIDKAGVSISEVKKFLLHQANLKMDEAILERLCKMYGIQNNAEKLMPLTISWLGNSSVATVPTLYDLLMKDNLYGHSCNSGDVIVFASVGAGLNINSVVYRIP